MPYSKKRQSTSSQLDERTIARLSEAKVPKILFFDIETAPASGYFFDLYRENNIVSTTQDWYMLCFAYKWLGEKTVHAHALIDDKYNPQKPDDWHVVEKLWHIFNEADVICAHNGDQFDIKKANTRFTIHGLQPPSPYKQIDTKKIAKKYFGFNSNKLDELGRQLGLGRKAQTGGFELWLDCMKGDRKAWAKMVAYNKQDVILLEQVYLKLRGWHKTHPNVSFFTRNGDECTVCRSQKIKRDGIEYYRGGIAQRYQCLDCGKHYCGPKVSTDKVESY